MYAYHIFCLKRYCVHKECKITLHLNLVREMGNLLIMLASVTSYEVANTVSTYI